MLVPHPGGGPLGQGLPGPWHPPRLPAGLGFALGFAASVVATILAWLLGAARDPAVGLILLIATAGIVGTLTTPVGAVASAAQCWAFYTGFILNRLGVLTFDHGSLTTLLVIVLTGIMPSLLLTTARRLPNTRHSIRTLAGWPVSRDGR